MQIEQPIKKNPVELVAEQGGGYAGELGIDLDGLEPTEIYKRAARSKLQHKNNKSLPY